jgi:hypothetical protein
MSPACSVSNELLPEDSINAKLGKDRVHACEFDPEPLELGMGAEETVQHLLASHGLLGPNWSAVRGLTGIVCLRGKQPQDKPLESFTPEPNFPLVVHGDPPLSWSGNGFKAVFAPPLNCTEVHELRQALAPGRSVLLQSELDVARVPGFTSSIKVKSRLL